MGRIASKLISEIRKHKSRKVVDLAAARTGRKQAEELQKTVTSREELAALLPSHAVYVAAENQISVLSEVLSALPQMARFVELIGQAEDEYLPAGPPMSPLTRSYFTCWALFDACVGIDKETIGTCILQLGPALGLDAGFLGIVRSMQESRMGFYWHEGRDATASSCASSSPARSCACLPPVGTAVMPESSGWCGSCRRRTPVDRARGLHHAIRDHRPRGRYMARVLP